MTWPPTGAKLMRDDDLLDALFAALLRPLLLDGAALRPRLDRLLASCNDALAGVEVSARYLLAVGRRAAGARYADALACPR